MLEPTSIEWPSTVNLQIFEMLHAIANGEDTL
jgi:hypothetical protein